MLGPEEITFPLLAALNLFTRPRPLEMYPSVSFERPLQRRMGQGDGDTFSKNLRKDYICKFGFEGMKNRNTTLCNLLW